MKERSFVDTNILLYTDDASNPEKRLRAVELLEQSWNTGNLVLSTQVLQEYFVAATRKLGVPVEKAQRKVELLGFLDIQGIEHKDILRAIDLHRLHGYSFWDSLIVHMAQKSSCSVLLTEDMQHGQTLGNLRIVNPFV